MNPCPETEAVLHDLLLGELVGDDRSRLEHHLESCQGCRLAVEEAWRGLLALEELDEPPLPYPSISADSEQSWQRFRTRLTPPAPPSGESWSLRLLAAAAVLVLGVGIGLQLDSRPPEPAGVATTTEEPEKTDTIALASLARVELLADIGVSYTRGLRDLLDRMATLDIETASAADLEGTREIARDLVRDGRLLRTSLDPARDRALLAAVDRAEIVLEEIAAVGVSGLGAPSLQLAIGDDKLRDQLTSMQLTAYRQRPSKRPDPAVREEGIQP